MLFDYDIVTNAITNAETTWSYLDYSCIADINMDINNLTENTKTFSYDNFWGSSYAKNRKNDIEGLWNTLSRLLLRCSQTLIYNRVGLYLCDIGFDNYGKVLYSNGFFIDDSGVSLPENNDSGNKQPKDEDDVENPDKNNEPSKETPNGTGSGGSSGGSGSGGSSGSGSKSSGGTGGGGGGGGASSNRKSQQTGQAGATGTYSSFWKSDANGVWRVFNKQNQMITTCWLCDDAVTANGQNIWYLLNTDGTMLSAGLVQDLTGNFYSLETTHNGFFGMLRYVDGYYDCNGQQVYLQFSKNHDGTFGAVINADGLAKLKTIYGVTQFGVGNDKNTYTSTF